MFGIAFGCKDTDLVRLLKLLDSDVTQLTTKWFPDPDTGEEEEVAAPPVPKKLRKMKTRKVPGTTAEKVILAWLLSRPADEPVFTTPEARAAVRKGGFHKDNAWGVLNNLVGRGLIHRVERGRYVVLPLLKPQTEATSA